MKCICRLTKAAVDVPHVRACNVNATRVCVLKHTTNLLSRQPCSRIGAAAAFQMMKRSVCAHVCIYTHMKQRCQATVLRKRCMKKRDLEELEQDREKLLTPVLVQIGFQRSDASSLLAVAALAFMLE